MNLNERLYRIRYRIDSRNPHLSLNGGICEKCVEQDCLNICPVDNFILEEGHVVLKWENCLECGACRIACPYGSIRWDYPNGAYGISYRYG